jgi:hypothetical protein
VEVATMIYVLAAIGTITIVVLLWRAFGEQRHALTDARRRATVAPDDDPDFLRKLGEQQRGQDNNGDSGG